MRNTIPWTVKTDYCHNGIPLSNGVFGALVWFQDATIMITVNRADYWDRRGGTVWTEECSFPKLRSLLEAGDFEGVRGLFRSQIVAGKEKKPTRMPLGRLELHLEDGARPVDADLDIAAGEARVAVRRPSGDIVDCRIAVLMEEHGLAIQCPAIDRVRGVPANEFEPVQEYFDTYEISSPSVIHPTVAGAATDGWVQPLPDDPGAAVLWSRTSFGFVAACESSTDGSAGAVVDTLERLIATASDGGYEACVADTKRRWADLNQKTASISLGDEGIETMYSLGMYKMLGNSMPGRVAPTLQGPWVEEHRMPPWSGDYHFNINVQECLWPAYAGGHLECLLPLFSMLNRWKPVLRERAMRFAGVPDGLQLSHACDDEGTTIGGFWTGAIDHANTSWVAQMMWRYYIFTGDLAFLEDTAVPFLVGAFRVFRAFMEGDDHSLPVTVSPEYGGSGNDAWGANSSFFRANIRFLCEAIAAASELLPENDVLQTVGEDAATIAATVPLFTVGGTDEEIYLWEGRPLEHSHRHHSHLAAIFPFDLVDVRDEKFRDLLNRSYHRWVQLGMGEWTGWSMPWASILHGRFGSADMAVHCLRILSDLFTMPGYGTRHNAVSPGFTVFAGGDIMQVEAAIAYSAAVLELFVQTSRGTTEVFSGIPDSIDTASFSGIHAEGGFVLSGTKTDGCIQTVSVESRRGGVLLLRNPWPGSEVTIQSKAIGGVGDGREARIPATEVISLDIEAGSTCHLSGVSA